MTTTKDFFGCEDQQLVDIYQEWVVQYNLDDERFTDSYNNANRWEVRHRHAPYNGVDANGNWHVTFTAGSLIEAVQFAKECLERAVKNEELYRKGQ